MPLDSAAASAAALPSVGAPPVVMPLANSAPARVPASEPPCLDSSRPPTASMAFAAATA